MLRTLLAHLEKRPMITVFALAVATIVFAAILLLIARVCWGPITKLDNLISPATDTCEVSQ
jgi:hypothetical protein